MNSCCSTCKKVSDDKQLFLCCCSRYLELCLLICMFRSFTFFFFFKLSWLVSIFLGWRSSSYPFWSHALKKLLGRPMSNVGMGNASYCRQLCFCFFSDVVGSGSSSPWIVLLLCFSCKRSSFKGPITWRSSWYHHWTCFFFFQKIPFGLIRFNHIHPSVIICKMSKMTLLL